MSGLVQILPTSLLINKGRGNRCALSPGPPLRFLSFSVGLCVLDGVKGFAFCKGKKLVNGVAASAAPTRLPPPFDSVSGRSPPS